MSSLGRVGILVKKRLRSVLQLVLTKAEKRHHETPAAGSRPVRPSCLTSASLVEWEQHI
jgi:hypothetical protein